MLPIHEQFYSFQGEGVHQGRAAYFIRTYGCPIHCPWCDSAGTWHPDYKAKKRQRIPIDQLVRNAQKTAAEFVVITGGEPTIHNKSTGKYTPSSGPTVHQNQRSICYYSRL